ncbi:magnesium/cobalt transporter CorA [Haloterrigena sp. SYSU A558-1]|uniref:Magnesium transport protein CorA n=1 Tax=Haloterrigena gelatinilytica TaxID=2741724 RepID=A0A8J8KGL7_9EURY|nr:magnesium/cobalt transporter CorA [Haloterrigena gelatinilytica]NUB90164.1 magnesium/cobalt transporter CorA [Haloterrigena gelatinilytica]NUC74015.1 magnesium/cobalt transporter CorA [Haloterrigena gelatinilytica]
MIEAVIGRRDGTVRTTTAEDVGDLTALRESDDLTWIDATDGDAGDLERLADAFDVHSLSVDDVAAGGRTKVEEFDAYTLVRVNVIDAGADAASGPTDDLRGTTLGLFIGANWLVTYAAEPVAAVDTVRAAVERNRNAASVRDRGADFLASRVVAELVEEYFDVLNEIEGRLERIEEAVIGDPSEATLHEINDVRRDLLAFRRLLWPTREAVAMLALSDVDHVRERTRKYYRDVYEELVELVELTETYRDLATGSRDVYLNALAMSTNDVMKKLTVVATIVLPLTFVAGVYGMNFGGSPYNMPELGWRFGYPAAMLGMAAVAALLVAYFRQEGWL